MLQRLTYGFILFALLLALLILGKSVILPFVYALIIWFVMKKVRDSMDKLNWVKKYIPRWIKTILSGLLISALLYLTSNALISSLKSLATSYPNYIDNIQVLSTKLNDLFQVDLREELAQLIESIDFAFLLQTLLNELSGLLGNAVMIFFYVIFLLLEERIFESKLNLILKDHKDRDTYVKILKHIDHSLATYIGLKSVTSLIGTVLSYFILLWSGIEAPLFWSLLFFILNIIPAIGPILGTLLPAIFVLIQFGTIGPFLIVLLGTGIISVLIGSFLEPRIMGNSLNISPLAAIFSLALWGLIWGIPGMLMCVPIMVALIIVMAQFKPTRNLAILLSEKGQI